MHVVDFGGNPDGPVLVLVHGLGGSHLNWDLLAPRLTGAGRVLALDLPGFGRSEPGERPGSVPANVAVLPRFLERGVGEPGGPGGQLDGRDDLDPAGRGAAGRW